MKIAHVFSDEKFIDKHIIKYVNSDFQNTYFYMKSVDSYLGINRSQVNYIKPGSHEYLSLVRDIDQYDILILYFLTTDKIQLVEDVRHSKVKIIWSFYGAELYSLPTLKYDFLSDRTQRAMGIKWGVFNLDRGKEMLRKGLHVLKGEKSLLQLVQRACKRIDYFLWYNKFEYDLLNEKLEGILPPFMQSTLNNRMEDVVPSLNRGNSIIIGNSRDPFNNHLDAFEVLAKVGYRGCVSIPFSYGVNLYYGEKLKKMVLPKGLEITFLETFVPYDVYIENLNNHCAAVYPSYRQIGLGNIFISVRCGLKIYLSDRNPTHKWLRDLGMKIYSFEKDFYEDLIKDNIYLDFDDVRLNNEVYDSLVSYKNDQHFFDTLRDLVK